MVKPQDLEPDISGLEFYLDAFRELGSCRINTMSLAPIPFTAIVEYFKVNPVGTFEEFHYYMRVMDNIYIEDWHLKDKSKPKPRK